MTLKDVAFIIVAVTRMLAMVIRMTVVVIMDMIFHTSTDNLLKKCKFQECSAIIFFLFVALITAAVNITTLSVRTCCCFTYLFGHNIYLPVTVYSLHILNTHLHFL